MSLDELQARSARAGRLHSPLLAWAILFAGFGVTLSAWWLSSRAVERLAEGRFETRVQEISQAIEERMQAYEQVLWGGVGLFHASEEVTRAEWASYVATIDLASRFPGIQGLGWSVPLAPGELAAHEAMVRAEGFPDYVVEPPGDRDHYSAIVYLEPFDWRNQRAFGYDMWSNDMRRAAMSRARDTGQASTSGIITLVQETDEDVQRGFLTYVPVYAGDEPPRSVEERRARFQGWVYAAFRAGDLIAGTLGFADEDLGYEIFDGGVVSEQTLLYDSDAAFRGMSPIQEGFQQRVELELQGRIWTLIFTSTASYASDTEQLQPTLVGLIGLVIDLLLFYVIGSLSLLNRRATSLAQEKTRELEVARDHLEERVQERTEELAAANAELARANRDLESFAYAASHDLRAPLRGIIQTLGWLEEDLGGQLDEGTRPTLELGKSRARRLEVMVEDLLAYSRAGRRPGAVEQVDVGLLVAEVLELLAPPEGFEVEVGELPTLRSERAPLVQVFTNLLGNAEKYGGRRVSVTAAQDAGVWTFAVADDGPGIDPAHHEAVFEMFRKLESRDKVEGAGLGLSLVRRLVEHQGGRVELESALGEGATFRFSWPSS